MNEKTIPSLPWQPPRALDVGLALEKSALLFRERNAEYRSNFEMVGPMMAILFPQGVPVELLRNDSFHLFELVLVKLSRLAISRLKHRDSAQDATVYCAMIDAIIQRDNEGEGE